MEAGEYQRAAHDEELRRAWKEHEDPLAHAFLMVAAIHRDAALGQRAGAVTKAEDALELLREEVEEGWTRKTLIQHVEQCVEYLGMGKPLPEIPSGL